MNPRTWKHLTGIVLAALAVLALGILLASACGKEPSGETTYYCPMHPTYTSDRPGDCPICNMKLVPKPESDEHAGHGASAVDGMAGVTVDAHGRALAGIQTAVAERRPLARRIRTVGNVLPDESRIRHVHTRIDGYVEKLFVSSTGQFVRQGDPVLAIYSPELLASQEEFLRARAAAARFAQSEIPEVRRGGEDLLQSARQRLRLFEVPESFIAALEESGVAQRTVTLLAHVSGFVTQKNVLEGQHVEPGTELYTVTDLSRVWVEADFYENEARFVEAGRAATVTLPYETSAALPGVVSYVYPFLERETRTLRVRFEFANPDLRLKPSMYVDVSLQIDAPPGVVVPASAVLDSGLRKIVFVETEPNRFEPREVQVGMRNGEGIEITAGVEEGEAVVVKANFLLDSESRLRGAFSGAKGSGHEHGGTP